MKKRNAVPSGLALCALALLASAAAVSADAPVATRALLARLKVTGRAEATLRLRRQDLLSGRTVTLGGRLALEPPGLARLDLEDGQRLTLRRDGGDWLQPATRQLVRAGARAAAGALQWWTALLDPGAAGLEERKLGPDRYALTRGAGADTLTQVVELGADRLPRRLWVDPGYGGRVEYQVLRWRFTRPRGRAAFVLEPPPGFETVEMP
jgi:hypothetical protein